MQRAQAAELELRLGNRYCAVRGEVTIRTMNLELGGNVAVVTGGASGIGWACAQLLASEGCRVALWDVSTRTKEMATALSCEVSVPSHGQVVDLSDAAAVETALRDTETVLGPPSRPPSHLVHAAAIGSGRFGFPFTNLQPGDWPRVLEVNIMGMVHAAHAFAPGMMARRSGS